MLTVPSTQVQSASGSYPEGSVRRASGDACRTPLAKEMHCRAYGGDPIPGGVGVSTQRPCPSREGPNGRDHITVDAIRLRYIGNHKLTTDLADNAGQKSQREEPACNRSVG